MEETSEDIVVFAIAVVGVSIEGVDAAVQCAVGKTLLPLVFPIRTVRTCTFRYTSHHIHRTVTRITYNRYL